MTSSETAFLTVEQCRLLLDGGDVSSVELAKASLERVRALDGELGAFLLVTDDMALETARRADERIKRGQAGPLTGVPYALKDIISTRGIRTTCGSKILENYVPVYQGLVADRLNQQDAVLIGKTNMDEFAMGSSNEHSAFFPARNPWDVERVPGGSSGGSAAAVASGMVHFALGTDTGGSIRQPAALCGAVGVKPTYGRVSRYGLVAFASSLDQIGPITRTVSDAASVLGVIAGHDSRDATSLRAPVPNYAALDADPSGDRPGIDRPLTGLRVGLPVEYFPETLDAGVAEPVRRAVQVLSELGAELIDISLPTTEAALSCYYVLAPSEAMSNLARYDGVRFGYRSPATDVWDMFDQTREHGFGAEVKRRILLGAYALSKGYYDAYYVKSQQVRSVVKSEFARAFSRVDVIAGPTSPTTAFKLGERVNDPLAMYLADAFTLPANIAGICGLSVPCGLAGGLPVGLQILGPELGEEVMFRVAHAYERTARWLMRPERGGPA